MPRYLLMFIILLMPGFKAGAQHIHMTDTSNVWYVKYDGGGTEYHLEIATYRYTGDTMIAGNSYRIFNGQSKLYQHNAPYTPTPGSVYLREDTAAGMVWSRFRNVYSSDTSERMIYNRSWKVGDTIWAPARSGLHYRQYIATIDSTQINGTWHRVFNTVMKGITNQGTFYAHIVEGLGSTLGPSAPFYGIDGGETGIQLLCFFNRGQKPALIPALPKVQSNDGFSNTKACNLGINDVGALRSHPYLLPNPANSQSRFILPKVINDGTLDIYNGLGQICYSFPIKNTAELPLSPAKLVAGVYYYRIIESSRQYSASGSFIVQ